MEPLITCFLPCLKYINLQTYCLKKLFGGCFLHSSFPSFHELKIMNEPVGLPVRNALSYLHGWFHLACHYWKVKTKIAFFLPWALVKDSFSCSLGPIIHKNWFNFKMLMCLLFRLLHILTFLLQFSERVSVLFFTPCFSWSRKFLDASVPLSSCVLSGPHYIRMLATPCTSHSCSYWSCRKLLGLWWDKKIIIYNTLAKLLSSWSYASVTAGPDCTINDLVNYLRFWKDHKHMLHYTRAIWFFLRQMN